MTETDIIPELSCSISARRILLSGRIDESKSHDFKEAILELGAVDPDRTISIYIDTYGGSSYDMFAMYDTMMMVPCPITTIGIGKVMSGGVLLLAAGNKRYITPNTMVMMHQVSTEMQGEVDRLNIELDHVRSLQERMYSLYSKYTGQTASIIKYHLKNDKYMTAEQAISYGIADELLVYSGDR